MSEPKPFDVERARFIERDAEPPEFIKAQMARVEKERAARPPAKAKADLLALTVNNALAKAGAFYGPPRDRREPKLSRWKRNTIDWTQAPEGCDGWAKRGVHAWWLQTRYDMRTREPSLERMALAPLFLPDEQRNVTTGYGTQPPLWRRVRWFLGFR